MVHGDLLIFVNVIHINLKVPYLNQNCLVYRKFEWQKSPFISISVFETST